MKKTKLLMPMIGVATIAGAMIPLASCSCTNGDGTNMIYQDGDSSWSELVSSKFNIKKGETYNFSFKWKRGLKLAIPPLADKAHGWHLTLVSDLIPTTEGSDVPFEQYLTSIDASGFTLKKNGNVLTKDVDYELSETIFPGFEGELVGLEPLKALDMKENDIISGTYKIKKIVKETYRSEEDWDVDDTLTEADDCFFTVYAME